jgi:hypothetical protein
MDQPTQPQPPVQPQPAPATQAEPQKKSKVWLWILGGCLGIIVIGMLIMGGLAWWGAKKVKKAIKENQPKLEEMQKNAADWQKQMEKAQQEMQKNLPNNTSPSAN